MLCSVTYLSSVRELVTGSRVTFDPVITSSTAMTPLSGRSVHASAPHVNYSHVNQLTDSTLYDYLPTEWFVILRTAFMTCSHLNATLLFLSDCGILQFTLFPKLEQIGTAHSLIMHLKSTSDYSFYDYCCTILFILYFVILPCIFFVPIFRCTSYFCISISIVIVFVYYV